MCRTPFQALLIERIIARTGITKYDLLYYNPRVLHQDRAYFQRIAAGAEYAALVSRGSLRGLEVVAKLLSKRYGSLMLGNHTFSGNRLIVRAKSSARVFTFDEGAGNFDADGALHNDRRKLFEKVRDRILGAPSFQSISRRSAAHFTIDTTLPNILPAERLRDVGFQPGSDENRHCGAINVIVGQPFMEYLTAAETQTMRTAFASVPNARYIPHPREQLETIPDVFDVWTDPGSVIEDQVFSLRQQGHMVRLVGGYSTVFATIRGAGIERYYLEANHSPQRRAVMQKIGCHCFDLQDSRDRAKWHELCSGWSAARTALKKEDREHED
jgi:hypothetical protein